MNSTDFFERGELPSSERFWTSIFALFLLHMANKPSESIQCWMPRITDTPPYFDRHASAKLDVFGLSMSELAVEPRGLEKILPGIGLRLTGVEPDIVIVRDQRKRYDFIENKITTNAKLNSNQADAYPSLIEALENRDKKARMFALISYGCSKKLFKQLLDLRASPRLEGKFGVILWEDVFRQMSRTRFNLPGFDITQLEPYWQEGAKECLAWDA